jgi:OmpA-OmpF porin, OOP family
VKTYLMPAALAIIASSAAATPYGVLSVGRSSLKFDCEGAAQCDKTNTGVKLMAGYRFTPQLGAELGYHTFGRASATDGFDGIGLRSTALGVGLSFQQDIGSQWMAFARLGVAQVRTRLSVQINGVGEFRDTDKNVQPYGGLGIGYRLDKQVSLDGAWDFYTSEYSKDGIDESGRANVLSVGLTFSF